MIHESFLPRYPIDLKPSGQPVSTITLQTRTQFHTGKTQLSFWQLRSGSDFVTTLITGVSCASSGTVTISHGLRLKADFRRLCSRPPLILSEYGLSTINTGLQSKSSDGCSQGVRQSRRTPDSGMSSRRT